MLTLLQAIEHYTFIAADGVEMPLEEGTSGFITMNPGYIGRAELPESLKVSLPELLQVRRLFCSHSPLRPCFKWHSAARYERSA